MPADTTESVAEHSARLQPSINLHAPVTAFMFSCSGTQCTTPDITLLMLEIYRAILTMNPGQTMNKNDFPHNSRKVINNILQVLYYIEFLTNN